MPRRLVTAVLAGAVAAIVIPATAAHARCTGELYEPGTVTCIVTCAVHHDLTYC